MQYYTDLKWVRMVNLALRKEKKDLDNIFDILKVKDAGRKPTKILLKVHRFIDHKNGQEKF